MEQTGTKPIDNNVPSYKDVWVLEACSLNNKYPPIREVKKVYQKQKKRWYGYWPTSHKISETTELQYFMDGKWVTVPKVNEWHTVGKTYD